MGENIADLGGALVALEARCSIFFHFEVPGG